MSPRVIRNSNSIRHVHPSPGTIYPTLQLLEDTDLAASSDVGGRKVYDLRRFGFSLPALHQRDRPPRPTGGSARCALHYVVSILLLHGRLW